MVQNRRKVKMGPNSNNKFKIGALWEKLSCTDMLICISVRLFLSQGNIGGRAIKVVDF